MPSQEKELFELKKGVFIESVCREADSCAKALYSIAGAIVQKPEMAIDCYLEGFAELLRKCSCEMEDLSERARMLDEKAEESLGVDTADFFKISEEAERLQRSVASVDLSKYRNG